MKINLAKSAGFCFGVKRALKIALDTVGKGKRVCMLGDIVHNEDVVREIERAGIKKIRTLGKGKNKTLLIRAHGAPINTIKKALNCGYKIIDATCPMVKEVHKIAKDMEKKGYKIIVIGDKNHDEVHGIIGQLKGRAIVIDNPEHIPLKIIKNLKKACVVVQSTQNLYNVLKIMNFLKPHLKELKFFNTICQPTRMKQEEIRKMPCENDVMIIIGSRTSANTRRLFEISKAINKRAFWIRSERDLHPEWFKGAKSVGITAGASTPEETTKGIIESIKYLYG
jgi:4-hydroxy-3-methylbut-2-enyl diphosphate reductase